MLYIYLETHQIKLMYLKKSLLGQYEVSFFSKNFDVDLIQNGLPNNIDVINSAVKKIFDDIPEKPLKEKEVTLVIPQGAFSFFRAEMPVDITPGVLQSYLKEKARTELNIDIEITQSDYLIQESDNQKQILFYAINKATVESYEQPFKLLDLKLTAIIPESLTYYKLFEKTLRKNKKENIWYVSYEEGHLHGYVYDSFGLLDGEKWVSEIKPDGKVEKILQKKAAELLAKDTKLNRLILSGKKSEGVRQDTFTKDVGVWTNPLIRIIPHFYGEYLKLLQHETKPLPVLEYDMLIGGFIFSQENKTFSLLGKATNTSISQRTSNITDRKIPVKNIILFLLSFALTFAALYLFAQIKWSTVTAFKFPSMPAISIPGMGPTATPTPSPSPIPPSPTPTPSITRDKIRVKVLNGSGISGKASVVKEFLQEKGYGEILTANADAFDYETTVVQIKEDADAEIKKYIETDIASEVPKPVFETLNAEEAADIVIIVGTDFK